MSTVSENRTLACPQTAPEACPPLAPVAPALASVRRQPRRRGPRGPPSPHVAITRVSKMVHLKVQDAPFFPRISDGGIAPMDT
jgi:hypothetical protein